MTSPDRPPGPTRRPGLSVRMQLTLSYAGFLALAGVALSVVLLLVLRYLPDGNLVLAPGGGFVPNRSDLLRVAVPLSAVGVGSLGLIGLVGGWILAGRMLRPLATIADAVGRVGEGSLSHRIAMPGADDEFRRLADGFDQMLARLERAFEEQRRFTANASHELRTPQAVTKTILQVARADPAGRDVDQVLGRLEEVNERSIATLDALLHLARADRDGGVRARFDLAEVVEEAIGLAAELPDGGRVRLIDSIAPADVIGNRDLMVRLAGNLVQNAIVHNLPAGGTVWVQAGPDATGHPVLSVENTGETLAPELVSRLAEPFVRAEGRIRTGSGSEPSGSGLGLAIVASVARAHHADLRLRPRPGGGLSVVVRFPLISAWTP